MIVFFALYRSNIISAQEIEASRCIVQTFVWNAASGWQAEVGVRGLIRIFAEIVRAGLAAAGG